MHTNGCLSLKTDPIPFANCMYAYMYAKIHVYMCAGIGMFVYIWCHEKLYRSIYLFLSLSRSLSMYAIYILENIQKIQIHIKCIIFYVLERSSYSRAWYRRQHLEKSRFKGIVPVKSTFLTFKQHTWEDCFVKVLKTVNKNISLYWCTHRTWSIKMAWLNWFIFNKLFLTKQV